MFSQLYPHLLAFHSLLRWLVLAAALVAMTVALSGWSGTKLDNRTLLRFAIIFVIALDLEFLLGLILYFAASPITHQAFQDMGAAMKVKELRFFAVEHTILMVLAVLLGHIGAALARKSQTVVAQHRRAAICFALSFVFMLLGTPWFRPLLRLG